jgi:hypothetical protein
MSPKPHSMPRSVVGASKVRKFNHRTEPIKFSVHKTRAGLRTIRTEMFRWPQSLTATPRGLRLPLSGYAEIGLQCGPSWPNKLSCAGASLFGEGSPYIQYHRAPPAVIGD